MEILFEHCNDDQSEEASEKCISKIEKEENFDLSEYDYNKRLWF